MPKRTTSFLITIGLFGVGLGFTLSMLDPLIYTEKVRQIASPALKNTTLSFITIMALLVALVAQPIVGHWSDHSRSRWGKRAPFLTGGVIGLSLSLVLIAFANNLWLLIIGAMLASAFSNATQGTWQALIPDQIPEKQHGTAAGIKTLLELIGVVAGVSLAGYTLAQGYVWVTPLVGSGLIWMILLITLYALWTVGSLRRPTDPIQTQSATLSETSRTQSSTTVASEVEPEEATDSKKIKFTKLTKWRLQRNLPNETGGVSLGHFSTFIQETPAFFWWIVNRLLFWSSGIAIRTFFLTYMEDVLKLPLTEIQTLSNRFLLILGLGVLLLVLPAGAIADRIGRRPLLIAAGLLASIGAILLLFINNPYFLFAPIGLIACGAGIYASASWALATDLAPKASGALYLGIANGATVLGSISGRLGGPVIDGLNQLTHTSTWGYITVFGLAALFFAASSLVVLKIPDSNANP